MVPIPTASSETTTRTALSMLRGPSVADRIIALVGLLVTILGGVLVYAAWVDSGVSIDTVLVVALLGFVAIGVVARYIEQRGG